MHTEFAGKLDRRGPFKTTLQQPFHEGISIDFITNLNAARRLFPLLPAWHRLQQSRKRCDDDLRRRSRFPCLLQLTEHPQSSSENRIGDIMFIRECLPGRKDLRNRSHKAGQIAGKFVNFRETWKHNQQHGIQGGSNTGCRQRA